MINTVSELRAALMIDLESDSDIAMLDASCEVAEYAMESAAFEYDGVNTAALEAADESLLDRAGKMVKEACAKVKKFCIAAIRTIRMILPKLKMVINQGMNKIRTEKAKRMAEKVGKFNKSTSAAGYAMEDVNNSVAKLLADGLQKDPKKFVDECLRKVATDTDKVGTTKELEIKSDDFFKDYENVTGTTSLSASDAKRYLDKAVGYLNSLNDSTKLEKEWLDSIKKGANTTGIRRAMISSYNVATSAVRKYYHTSMDLANRFCKVDKHYDIKKMKKENKTIDSSDKFAAKHGMAHIQDTDMD